MNTDQSVKKQIGNGDEKSYFDGGYLAYIGYSILIFLATIFTLGIAYPWVICGFQRWKARHTVICGKREFFDGTGVQLIGKYLLWLFLTYITCGIYSFWLTISMKKWLIKHTHFEGEPDNNSYFDGGLLGLVGINILRGLITLATFGIGAAWGEKMVIEWESKHTVIDSRRLIFTGTGGSLFVKYLVWGLLSSITCGIFALFVPVKSIKWQTERTIDNEHTTEALIKRSEYRTTIHTDAATFKTYSVENEMECVKAGITNSLSQNELLSLAESGSRSAQYEYVMRYADGKYNDEPFKSFILSSANQGFAPSMQLAVISGLCDESTFDTMLKQASDKGQSVAMTILMRKTAEKALAMPENLALNELKEAIRLRDLLVENENEITSDNAELIQKCVLAVRRIESAKKVGKSGAKVAAAIGIGIAALLVLTLIIGGVAAIFGLRMGTAREMNSIGNNEYFSIEQDVFMEEFTEKLEEGKYEIVLIDSNESLSTSASLNKKTKQTVEKHYLITCNYWYWESKHEFVITSKDEKIVSVGLSGKRVLDPDSPDPTINEVCYLEIGRMLFDILEIDEMELTSEYIESSTNVEEKYSVDQHNTKDTLNVIITAN